MSYTHVYRDSLPIKYSCLVLSKFSVFTKILLSLFIYIFELQSKNGYRSINSRDVARTWKWLTM